MINELAPRASDSVDLGWGLEGALLTNSQVLLMLLVPGTHFENHSTDSSKSGVQLGLPFHGFSNIKYWPVTDYIT